MRQRRAWESMTYPVVEKRLLLLLHVYILICIGAPSVVALDSLDWTEVLSREREREASIRLGPFGFCFSSDFLCDEIFLFFF